MTYEVYTDGAVSSDNKRMAGGYFIKTDNRFVKTSAVDFIPISDSINSTTAEVLAVGAAVDFILANIELQKEDKIIIYTDCKFARNVLRDNTYNIEGTAAKKEVTKVRKLLEVLAERCAWKFKMIPGHAFIGGNSLVDRLAKYAVRQSTVKE